METGVRGQGCSHREVCLRRGTRSKVGSVDAEGVAERADGGEGEEVAWH